MINDWVLWKIAEFAGGKSIDKGLEQVVQNRTSLLRYLSTQTLERSTRTRVSAAELLSLKNGSGKYLLIKNFRRGHFGPIGGVIRCHPSGQNDLNKLARFEWEDEKSLDIRGFTTGRYFPAFLKWFYAERGREKLALARELREELLEVKCVDLSREVGSPEFELLRVVHEGPCKVPGELYQQYRVVLIKEFADDQPTIELKEKILSTAEKLIESCLSKGTAPEQWPFIFVTEEEIRKGVTKKIGQRIGDHSGYLFGKDRIGAEPPAYSK
jgi:hypothetical protein